MQTLKSEFFPSPESIIAETARYYKLNYDDLIGYDRECNKTNARCVAIYLIRKLTNFSLKKTGELFDCDHNRVKSSLCHVEGKMRYDPEFSGEIKSIITKIEDKALLKDEPEGKGLQPISTIMEKTCKRIMEVSNKGTRILGLTTGLIELDNTLTGLNKSDLIIIASRPGMGKTSLALNIALHVASKYDMDVAFFSLEMSDEQLALRLLSSQALIDCHKLQVGMQTHDEWQRMAEASSFISQTKLFINDQSITTVDEINAQCKRMNNIGLIIIDYLQLMESASQSKESKSGNRIIEMSEITRMMKKMAKGLNVPVICLSQLNREIENRSDKRPVLSDMRGLGSILLDADVILALYRDNYYSEEVNNNIAECIILKNRRGETKIVDLEWLPEYATFTTPDIRYDYLTKTETL